MFDCRNGLRHECVYYRSCKDFNDKNKKASYWDKIGQKIHLSAEEAEAKFLQHKNCIRSLSNPKPMFSTVLELATTRLIMTNGRSKFAFSKIFALPRSRCCLLFSLHARVYLTFSLSKTYACGRLCDRCDYIFFAIVCDLRSSAIIWKPALGFCISRYLVFVKLVLQMQQTYFTQWNRDPL